MGDSIARLGHRWGLLASNQEPGVGRRSLAPVENCTRSWTQAHRGKKDHFHLARLKRKRSPACQLVFREGVHDKDARITATQSPKKEVAMHCFPPSQPRAQSLPGRLMQEPAANRSLGTLWLRLQGTLTKGGCSAPELGRDSGTTGGGIRNLAGPAPGTEYLPPLVVIS